MSESLREHFVAELRALVGTPFRHQGRVPGVGLDCVGVGVVAARAVGLEIRDELVYERQSDGERLLARLRENAEEIAIDDARMGDALVVWFDRGSRHPQHVVFLVSTRPSRRIVHAWQDAGRVCECELGPMAARTVAAFRLRGID